MFRRVGKYISSHLSLSAKRRRGRTGWYQGSSDPANDQGWDQRNSVRSNRKFQRRSGRRFRGRRGY